MENADKNPIPNNKKFGIDQPQPSPEAKSRGWERRREAQQIADELMKIKDLSYAELEKMKEDIKVHPENYTVMQVKLMQYMSSSKLTVDWIDRHISKAPQEVDVTSKGERLSNIYQLEIVDGSKTEDSGNEDTQADDISPEDI